MSSTDHTFIVGIYDDSAHADRVITSLHNAGLQDSQIAVDSREKGSQSVQNALVNVGMPESEARIYEEALGAGQLIMVIRADEQRDDVVNLMRRNGGNHVWYAGVQEPLDRIVTLREERLQTSKQMVVSGEVRIHRRVVIEERTITVKIAREEIVVEQISLANGNQGATSADANSRIVNLNPGQDLHILVREEQVFLEKRPIIKEEVVVRKQLVQDVKHISESVQKEVPHLEREGNVRIHTGDNLPVQ